MSKGVSGRRAAGVAAALMMAGGLAGTLMTGTAYAGPIIFTSTTSITGTSQAAPAWNGADPVVTVNVSVTAGGGSAPTGKVTVNVAGRWENCKADLTAGSGLTSSGSCKLQGLAPGSYTLSATYPGGSQLAKSDDGSYPLTVSSSTGQNATVTTALACPAAVNAGQSGNCKLTVTNKGPGTAVNVDAKIFLPSALKARYCGNVWWNQGCSVNNNTASWRLGNLRAWQSRSLTVHFTAAGNRWYRHSSLVTVTGSATWGVNFPGQGPMQHISVSKYRVEIRPWGFVF
jgi:uncharacterized protein DUF11